jgi:DNA-binding NarL/FixJ family response regulator
MNQTSIGLLEDHGSLALATRIILQMHYDTIVKEINPLSIPMRHSVKISATSRQLQQWLDQQPPESVLIMLIDFNLYGSNSSEILSTLSGKATGFRHIALYSEALLIGWSAHNHLVTTFKDLGADAFISKQLHIESLAKNIVAAIRKRRTLPWVQVMDDSDTWSV